MKNIEIGKIKLFAGVKANKGTKKAICRICELPILMGQEVVCIKSISEYPKEFHKECSIKLASTIIFLWEGR